MTYPIHCSYTGLMVHLTIASRVLSLRQTMPLCFITPRSLIKYLALTAGGTAQELIYRSLGPFGSATGFGGVSVCNPS
jgi:hypothetical protein